MIVCTTGHMEKSDKVICEQLLLKQRNGEMNYWIHDTYYGFMIRCYCIKKPLLVMKRAGFTKAFRKNVYIMMERMEAGVICFDMDGPEISGLTIREW